MKILPAALLLCVSMTALPSLSAEVSLESLLAEMANFAAIAWWPSPEFTCKQTSSFDRATVAPDQPDGRILATERKIVAGGELSLELPPGPAAVKRLELCVSPTTPERAPLRIGDIRTP